MNLAAGNGEAALHFVRLYIFGLQVMYMTENVVLVVKVCTAGVGNFDDVVSVFHNFIGLILILFCREFLFPYRNFLWTL